MLIKQFQLYWGNIFSSLFKIWPGSASQDLLWRCFQRHLKIARILLFKVKIEEVYYSNQLKLIHHVYPLPIIWIDAGEPKSKETHPFTSDEPQVNQIKNIKKISPFQKTAFTSPWQATWRKKTLEHFAFKQLINQQPEEEKKQFADTRIFCFQTTTNNQFLWRKKESTTFSRPQWKWSLRRRSRKPSISDF